MESSAAGWEVRLKLDNVHNELSGQGGDRKQQKPWGRNPGFHLLVLNQSSSLKSIIPFAVSSQVGRMLLLCFCAICISISVSIP